MNGGTGMPDWLTHTLAGWITGKAIKMEVGLIVAGSLIPDLIKINLAFLYFDINLHHFLNPFHTPAGAFIVAGIFALFFEDAKKAFIPLGIGVITHFILDFFLVHFGWDENSISCQLERMAILSH